MDRGLYIHIPFCQNICTYCDFAKMYYNKNFVDKYLLKLKEELDFYKIDDVSSIYIGGGTPSCLSLEQIEELLKMLMKYIKPNISFTFEANVENLTIDKIKLLKKYSVNRVSLGIQSFDTSLLKLMNRKHDLKMVKEVIDALVSEGIKDINCDLIYGLPSQTLEMLDHDLDILLSLPITHISTYSLMINDNTILKIKNYKEATQEIYRNYYDHIVKRLKDAGFKRYEISNFAKDNFQSKHNLLYWKNKEYYGVGIGASGYLNKIRYSNTKSINKYLNGNIRIYEENVSLKDEEIYFIFLGLRLEEGISLNEYKLLFNKNFKEIYKEQIEILKNKDLIEICEDSFKIKEEHMYILDYIVDILLYRS